jgi:hypothetical protein
MRVVFRRRWLGSGQPIKRTSESRMSPWDRLGRKGLGHASWPYRETAAASRAA